MKKTLFAAAMLLSTAAFADTVTITSVSNLTQPNGTISSQGSYAFVGTPRIVFTVAGKTCNFVGSGSVSAPIGCNYSLTVNNSTNTLSDMVSNSSPGCTPTSQMAAACH